MPPEGTAVVLAPAKPSEVGQHPRQENWWGREPERKEPAVRDAAALADDQFRTLGWSSRDTTDAVTSFVAGTKDGKTLLLQAKQAQMGSPKRYYDDVVYQIAQASARRGYVQVFTSPPHVTVVLGEVVRGVTEVEFWCSSGRHELRLEKLGYKNQTVIITVEPQLVTVVKARMAK